MVLNDATSKIIRTVYKIYKDDYAKKYNKASPDKLYQHLDIPEPPDPREEPEYEEYIGLIRVGDFLLHCT